MKGLFLEVLIYRGKFIVGGKFPFLLCFPLYLGAISKYKPWRGGGYIWREDLMGGFLCCEFGGLIFGGAYTYAWRGLVLELYRNFTKNY